MSAGLCVACFAWAIAEAETGNNPGDVGRKGERTKYQFMRTTWESYSDVPFHLAVTDQEEVYRVFRAHVDWIYLALNGIGKETNPVNMAVTWNAGYGRVLRGTVPRSSLEYALRVENLYEHKRRKGKCVCANL